MRESKASEYLSTSRSQKGETGMKENQYNFCFQELTGWGESGFWSQDTWLQSSRKLLNLPGPVSSSEYWGVGEDDSCAPFQPLLPVDFQGSLAVLFLPQHPSQKIPPVTLLLPPTGREPTASRNCDGLYFGSPLGGASTKQQNSFSFLNCCIGF